MLKKTPGPFKLRNSHTAVAVDNGHKRCCCGEYHDSSNPKKSPGAGWILTSEQMEFLRHSPFVYNASAGSYLEMFCLQRFWTWLAKFTPQTMAPSVITCTGLAINIMCCASVLYYSPDARLEAPWWTFLLCAIGLFLYQTLDSLDGKQADKVQDCAIEELYDHGCDSISNIFVTLSVCIACQMGQTPLIHFSIFLLTSIVFFSTHWLYHASRQMVFGKIDITEGQWAMIVIHLITVIYGQTIWHRPISIGGLFDLKLVYLIGFATIVSLSSVIYNNVRMALGLHPTPLEALGVKVPRPIGRHVFYPLYSLFFMTILTIATFQFDLFHMSPILFTIAYGFAYAKLTVKLVMMNCCSDDMDRLDTCLIGPMLLAINCYLNLMNPTTALICFFICSFLDFVRYWILASCDIRIALDLNIFSIKYLPGHPKNRHENYGFYINGLNNEQVLKPRAKLQ